MILDKIENYKIYTQLSERIAKAFTYIQATDFSQIELGKHLIDGDEIFALVQEYDTKDISECKLEGHVKYIDIQYVISGIERIGITTLKGQTPITVNEENDYYFYDCDSTLIELSSGMFTIFFPDDLHKPGIKFNESSNVRKVVIKVRI